MSRYSVDLPILFIGGAGRTRVVSQEEVSFITMSQLKAGDRLFGWLNFNGEAGQPGIVLHFSARVLLVAPLADDELMREVHARFETLDVEVATE